MCVVGGQGACDHFSSIRVCVTQWKIDDRRAPHPRGFNLLSLTIPAARVPLWHACAVVSGVYS